MLHTSVVLGHMPPMLSKALTVPGGEGMKTMALVRMNTFDYDAGLVPCWRVLVDEDVQSLLLEQDGSREL